MTTTRFRGVLLCVLALLSVRALAAEPPRNMGFEDDPVGAPALTGWFVPGGACKATIVDTAPSEGKRCAMIERLPGPKEAAGNLMRIIEAADYRGKRIRISGQVRLAFTGGGGGIALWGRVDSPVETDGVLKSTQDRLTRSTEWQKLEVDLDVAPSATHVAFGVLLLDAAVGVKAFVDDVSISVLGEFGEGNRAAAPLSERGRTNLIALARLWGYMKWFNPADQALNVDFDRLLLAGIERIEPAADDAALARGLRELFGPHCPSLEIFVGRDEPPAMTPPPTPGQHTGMRHEGVLLRSDPRMPNIYTSRRLVDSKELPEDKRQVAPAWTTAVRELAPGIRARWLVTLAWENGKTQPESPAPTPAVPERPESWKPSAKDRTTRLADVIVLWCTMQHFYPYFDVVQTDWQAALPEALAAAADADAAGHTHALERMVARLHDGHGRVLGGPQSGFRLPAQWTWAGKELTIGDPGKIEGLSAGDVVLEINGVTVADWVARLAPRISAANEGWLKWRLLEVLPGEVTRDGEQVALKVRKVGGAVAEVSVKRVPGGGGMARLGIAWEKRPENGAELAPGIIYFDICGLSNPGLAKLEKQLVEARGIVVDARGYPADAATVFIRRLAGEAVNSAQWWIPLTLLPDREGQTWLRRPSWLLPPMQPRLTAHVAYVTDGRAISYAESCMAIVEHYKLAEIVGEPTAGTNGNVNPLPLPSGYSVMWTGMRVLRHDGGVHHGRGVMPTVPVSMTPAGIAAGRDEMIDAAVKVLAEKIAKSPPAAPRPKEGASPGQPGPGAE